MATITGVSIIDLELFAKEAVEAYKQDPMMDWRCQLSHHWLTEDAEEISIDHVNQCMALNNLIAAMSLTLNTYGVLDLDGCIFLSNDENLANAFHFNNGGILAVFPEFECGNW